MRKESSLLLVAVIAAACTNTTAVSNAPGASPSPPPTQTPNLSATPTRPAPIESPDVSLAPVPASTLTIRWNAGDPTGIGAVSSLVGVARSNDAYVLIAELPYREEGSAFAAWSSADGRAWKMAQEFPVGDRILALTTGGPGFVVSGFGNTGASVWTSVDGQAWHPVSDASLQHAVINELVPTASGIVGFGWRSDSDARAIWTSADGIEWLAATNETGRTVARGLQAIGAYEGRAVAFVDEGDTKGLAIWETTGRAEWTRTGVLKDATTMAVVAGGARGWVALDSKMAWTSPDGRAWSKAVPGPDVVSDVIVDDAGFVAVGFVGSLPGETCGDQRPFAGHTWTSADGRVWQRTPVSQEFKAAMVTRLMVVDRTLIGYGHRLSGGSEEMPVARWTAALPEVTKSAAASDKASVPKGCGG